MKVYGPYTRKDGRKHVILFDGNERTTVSWPKYLMEQKLGRLLTENETVDHINGDFTDDRLENLQILPRRDNIIKSAKSVTMYKFICPICNKEAEKKLSNVKGNWKKGKAGPFCSYECGYEHLSRTRKK